MVWDLRGIAGPARRLACLGRLAMDLVCVVAVCGCAMLFFFCLCEGRRVVVGVQCGRAGCLGWVWMCGCGRGCGCGCARGRRWLRLWEPGAAGGDLLASSAAPPRSEQPCYCAKTDSAFALARWGILHSTPCPLATTCFSLANRCPEPA